MYACNVKFTCLTYVPAETFTSFALDRITDIYHPRPTCMRTRSSRYLMWTPPPFPNKSKDRRTAVEPGLPCDPPSGRLSDVFGHSRHSPMKELLISQNAISIPRDIFLLHGEVVVEVPVERLATVLQKPTHDIAVF